MYVVGGYVLCAIVTGDSKDDLTSKKAKDFFSSFKLVDSEKRLQYREHAKRKSPISLTSSGTVPGPPDQSSFLMRMLRNWTGSLVAGEAERAFGPQQARMRVVGHELVNLAHVGVDHDRAVQRHLDGGALNNHVLEIPFPRRRR